MPNESSGKDLQIMCWSLLRQVAPSWRNLRHDVSTVRQTVSPKVLLSSSSFSWPLLGKLYASFPEKLPVGSQ